MDLVRNVSNLYDHVCENPILRSYFMKKLLIVLCVLTGMSSLVAMEAVVKEEVGEASSGETRVTSVSFSPDGRYIVSGSEDTLRVWDLSTDPITSVEAGSGATPIRFTEDGSMFIIEKEGVSRFYDAKTGEEIALV